ncbi:MAG: amidase family protein, partial [Proteobacteria bacterium]|nr:amidase family protein [Pseudomonadota bacterium]
VRLHHRQSPQKVAEASLVGVLTVDKGEIKATIRRWQRVDRPIMSGQLCRCQPGLEEAVEHRLGGDAGIVEQSTAFIRQNLADADALLLPVLPRSVPTIEETTSGSEPAIERIIGRLAYWTRGINYLGLPSLALPAGFSTNGLPVGVQLVGRPFAEASLFHIGHGFQQQTEWHCRRPEL